MIKRWSLPWLVRAWVDGDTCHGTMDKGWGVMWTPKKGLRLLPPTGTYDAPERRGVSMKRANEARAYAERMAPVGSWVMATSLSPDPDDFGRVLCSITLDSGLDLACLMMAAGHVK